MRVLSLNLREALFAEGSSEVLVFLLTITHEDLEDPIYLATDGVRLSEDPLVYGFVSRGTTYLCAGVDVTIPDEQDKAAPTSKLVIANVTRDLVPLARSVQTPPQVKIEAVLASAPDDVEMTWPAMDMSSLRYDASFLEFDLTMDSLTTEPYPSGTFSPAGFPGLFY